MYDLKHIKIHADKKNNYTNYCFYLSLFYVLGIYDIPAGFDAINRELGSAYMFTTIQKSWSDAKEFCKQKNSHLVAIETAEENDYLINTAVKQIWGKHFELISERYLFTAYLYKI